MTFRFGVVSEINADVATGTVNYTFKRMLTFLIYYNMICYVILLLVAFIVTVAFLVLLEHATKLAEHLLGSKATYNKMLQRIYMELMSTGFVSFALAMYQASNPKSQNISWLQVFDFIGYLIFFIAIFFVAHAIYIIILSVISAKRYESFHSTPVSKIVEKISALNNDVWHKMYRFRLLPISPLRSVAEFKIIHAMFRDT
jgi:hypothetical protein